MTGHAEANSGTTAVRAGYGFDIAALDRWMRSGVEGYAGPLTVEQFKGGQSNPTYKLATPGCSYVLRRKPPGQLLKGAHAIEREARVLTGLAAAGFPVARVHALCTDDSVIGTWFYVMELIEGRIFWDATFPGVDARARAACFDAMNATIAQLHSVDYAAVGLGEYGPRVIAASSRAIDSVAIRALGPVVCTIGGFDAALSRFGRVTEDHGDLRGRCRRAAGLEGNLPD